MMDTITNAIVAALSAASGRIVRVVYNTLPTTDAVRASRERSVAKRAIVSGAMIARVRAVDTDATDGTAVVVLAGRYDAARGAVRSKQGTDTIGLILSAPAEHTIGGALVPTACPNAGRDGTACADLAPRHGHRSLRTDRIVSITAGDAVLYDATA
jgi:hypothetical protein